MNFPEDPTSPEIITNNSLEWQGISYDVKRRNLFGKKLETKRILDSVSGSACPGQLVAIMGPSGSGKTTLLDILADRVSSGKIDGTISVNKRPRSTVSFRAVSAYVSQEDSLIGSFTVLETLRQSARLALPKSVDAGERERRVQHAIDMMGLRSCENVLIGDVFRKGVSGGQKRR
ncbi:hypothetical protein FOZ63_003441, partial [Perkinsus olseni]